MNELINKIHIGDCLELMRKLPDNSIDLILTDPPYGIGADKRAASNGGKKWGRAVAPHREYRHTNWDEKIPDAEVFAEMFRVSKHQIIWGGNYFIEHLKNSPCWLVWNKDNGTNYFSDCEMAWTSFPSAVRMFTYRWNGMLQGNTKDKEDRIHPTQKPLPLFRWCIEKYSGPGDIVLDCYSGSGTTAVACSETDRRFICVEKDPEYHAASIGRLEQFNAQGRLIL